MAADSAITGGNLGEREREYALKITPSLDGRGLVGFSGDHHHGARLMNDAAAIPAGNEALGFLLEAQRECPSVEFAYSYANVDGPRLFRVAKGRMDDLQTFHLGNTEAFEEFQCIRHNVEIDDSPEAIKTLFTGSRSTSDVPHPLFVAIKSMLRLFAERSERDVGGWVTPYYLTREGACLCGYGYAVSDPILSKIGPGSIIPHGTAEAGGFGLSVTELGVLQGVIVYWLQLPGGIAYLRTGNGYTAYNIQGGRPSLLNEHRLRWDNESKYCSAINHMARQKASPS
jgi:hypothetical protein